MCPVEWHVYLSGVTCLPELSDMSTWVEWHVYLSGVTFLPEWSDMSTWVEWHVYLSGVTCLPEWSDMSTCRLLFQWANTIINPTKCVGLVQNRIEYFYFPNQVPCAKRWSEVLETPSWSVVYGFSVDVFCKLGIDK
jgi:hypothetical protein